VHREENATTVTNISNADEDNSLDNDKIHTAKESKS